MSNTVSVIDTISGKQLDDLKVGLFPNSIALNPANKILYISNEGNHTISVINSTTNKDMNPIEIDDVGIGIDVNPKTNIVYVANKESKTISTINGYANNIESAILFHVYPKDAGYIECNRRIPLDSYQMILKVTQCKVVANKGFLFKALGRKCLRQIILVAFQRTRQFFMHFRQLYLVAPRIVVKIHLTLLAMTHIRVIFILFHL